VGIVGIKRKPKNNFSTVFTKIYKVWGNKISKDTYRVRLKNILTVYIG
jgi:hypothetical protein